MRFPTEQEYQRAVHQVAVEQWMADATAGDHALGRGEQNWAEPPTPALRPLLPVFRDRGIKVYVGGGQVVLADLSAPRPRLVQRRPLAQRELVLEVR